MADQPAAPAPQGGQQPQNPQQPNPGQPVPPQPAGAQPAPVPQPPAQTAPVQQTPAAAQPPVQQPVAQPQAPQPPVQTAPVQQAPAAAQPPVQQPVAQPQAPQPPAQTAPVQQTPAAAQPPQPVDPNARTGQLGKRTGHIFTIPPHPNTQFDEQNFLTLLEGSISLTMEEKQRVIDAIPRLSIEQINELISIFEEEKQKFSELEKEFADDVQKLKAEREKEIARTEDKREETSAADADAAAAEELKKQMGL